MSDRDTIEQNHIFSVRFLGRHGVELLEPLKVISQANDWMTAWNQIWDYRPKNKEQRTIRILVLCSLFFVHPPASCERVLHNMVQCAIGL